MDSDRLFLTFLFLGLLACAGLLGAYSRTLVAGLFLSIFLGSLSLGGLLALWWDKLR